MSFCCEIALRGDRSAGPTVGAWFDAGPRLAWERLADLSAFDVYVPAHGQARDPFNDDGPGPLLIAMLDFASDDGLRRAIAGDEIASALRNLPAGVTATATALERRFYPVAGESKAGPLIAPFSHVVRYHRPADEEAAFVANYVATHPTTQARLPAIRSILCYFPLDRLNPPHLTSADYLVGNEVVFDDIEAFNVAMASPARHELRDHFHRFPRFSGANTHYPMLRTRVFG